jgi:HPt (histidine-containing phosphotransfer) domain-containing protein
VDKSKLMQRLMGTFVEELDEHVRTLNQDLMALEKGVPAPEQAQRLQSLFRTAHSLKGAARSVGLALIDGPRRRALFGAGSIQNTFRHGRRPGRSRHALAREK